MAIREHEDTDAAGRRRLTLILCGDVMTGRGIDQILPHPGDPALHESYVKTATDYVRLAERANGPIERPVDAGYIWGDTLRISAATWADLRIVNLETSITASDDFWPGKGIHYRMHPANAPCLSAADIDCCVLANNHVLDWGYAGLAETLTTLRERGIAAAGAGSTLGEAARAARLSVPGKGDVLVYGVAGPDCGVPPSWRARNDRPGVALLSDLSPATARRIAAQVEADRGAGDTVIVSIHWGGNWGYEVPDAHRDFAHRLIDEAEVDVVHGHSSHHPKGIEIYRDKLILYGCGDFINDYEGIRGHEQYRPWLALLYLLSLDPRSGSVDKLELFPLQIRRMQLVAVNADDRRWLVERLNAASAPFSTRVESLDDRLVVTAA